MAEVTAMLGGNSNYFVTSSRFYQYPIGTVFLKMVLLAFALQVTLCFYFQNDKDRVSSRTSDNDSISTVPLAVEKQNPYHQS